MGKHQSDVQIVFVFSFFFPLNKNRLNSKTKLIPFLIIGVLSIYFNACSSTVRTTTEKGKEIVAKSFRIIASEKNQIRVLLADNKNPVELGLKGKYKFYSDNELVSEVPANEKLVFKKNGGGANTIVNKRELDAITFFLQPTDSSGFILFEGKKYSGDILVVFSDDSKLLVINRLAMDDYLPGVVHAEMAVKKDDTTKFQALKAFAICARTFAEMKKEKGNTYYDITDDIRDQVYDGEGNYTPMDKAAAVATSQSVLLYNNKLAEVFYHSACGGVLEDPANVFSGKVEGYLRMKKDGDDKPNCDISPTFNWSESFTAADILNALKSKQMLAKSQKTIKDIEIADTFESGRAKEIHIKFANAEDVVLQGPQIRTTLLRKDGKGILRSSLFTLSKEMTKTGLKKVTITGKGSGHGVGLCQWGSMNLSMQGKTYQEILDFYFTGCTIGKRE